MGVVYAYLPHFVQFLAQYARSLEKSLLVLLDTVAVHHRPQDAIMQ